MKYSSNILRIEHFSEFFIFMDSFSTMLNVSRFNHKIIEFRNTLFLTMEFSIDINRWSYPYNIEVPHSLKCLGGAAKAFSTSCCMLYLQIHARIKGVHWKRLLSYCYCFTKDGLWQHSMPLLLLLHETCIHKNLCTPLICTTNDDKKKVGRGSFAFLEILSWQFSLWKFHH
jgi:hypothetical protein